MIQYILYYLFTPKIDDETKKMIDDRHTEIKNIIHKTYDNEKR